MDFAILFIKLIFTLAFVLGLMYLTFKLSGDKINKFNSSKYINVLERTQVSKDAFITVVKVGKKGYILSISNNKIEKLDELSYEEVLEIQENKIIENKKINDQYNLAISQFKSKINSFYKRNN